MDKGTKGMNKRQRKKAMKKHIDYHVYKAAILSAMIIREQLIWDACNKQMTGGEVPTEGSPNTNIVLPVVNGEITIYA